MKKSSSAKATIKSEWDLLDEEPEESAENVEAEIEQVNGESEDQEPTLPHEEIFPINHGAINSVTKKENSVTKKSKKATKPKDSIIIEDNSVTKKSDSVTNTVPSSPEQILDTDALWREFCDLRGSSGVNQLFALLTAKTLSGVKGLQKNSPHFLRGFPVAGFIKMYRELKKKGYI